MTSLFSEQIAEHAENPAAPCRERLSGSALGECAHVIFDVSGPCRMSILRSECPRNGQRVPTRVRQTQPIEHGLPLIDQVGPDVSRGGGELSDDPEVELMPVERGRAVRIVVKLADVAPDAAVTKRVRR